MSNICSQNNTLSVITPNVVITLVFTTGITTSKHHTRIYASYKDVLNTSECKIFPYTIPFTDIASYIMAISFLVR